MEISSAAKTLTTLGWFDIRFRPLPTYPTGCCTLHPVDSAGSQRGLLVIYHYIDSCQCVTSKFLRICPTYTHVTFQSVCRRAEERRSEARHAVAEHLDHHRRPDYSARIPADAARPDLVVLWMSLWRRMRGRQQRKECHSVTMAMFIGRRDLPAHHAGLLL